MERKKLKNILRPSKRMGAFLANALESHYKACLQPIIVVDNNLIIKHLNSAALMRTKRTENDLINSSIHTLLPSISHNQLMAREGQADINGQTISFATTPVTDSKKSTNGFVICLASAPELSSAEKELRSTQNQLALAIETAGFDIWEVDLSTGLRKGAQRIFKDLGYDNTPKTHDELYRLVHPEDLPHLKQAIDNHLSGVSHLYTCEFRVKSAKGTYQWVGNYGRIVQYNQQGNPELFMGLSLNIDERKKTETKTIKQNEELKQSNAEKDKFFSIIAHDLKGPFQGFIGLSELLALDTSSLSHSEIKEIAVSLKSSAKNLYELLDNLLNWALIKRGHKQFNPQKMPLNPIVQTVIDLVTPQATIKNIKIINRTEPDLALLTDKESLKTILRNLLSNSVKFTPTKGKVTINTQLLPKGLVEISISDTGIGMSKELVSKLFAVNQKVSRPGTANEPSTGLGLILCKELIIKQGGSIEVDSHPGHGSTFRFTVPMAC